MQCHTLFKIYIEKTPNNQITFIILSIYLSIHSSILPAQLCPIPHHSSAVSVFHCIPTWCTGKIMWLWNKTSWLWVQACLATRMWPDSSNKSSLLVGALEAGTCPSLPPDSISVPGDRRFSIGIMGQRKKRMEWGKKWRTFHSLVWSSQWNHLVNC